MMFIVRCVGLNNMSVPRTKFGEVTHVSRAFSCHCNKFADKRIFIAIVYYSSSFLAQYYMHVTRALVLFISFEFIRA